MKPTLAFYSSIPCEPTFGGPLQIYRHFRERDDFEFIDLNEAKEDLWADWIGKGIATSRAFQRISNTRFYPWLLSRAYTTRLGRESENLAERIRASGAEAVVTVAYGRRCYVARNAAKLLGIPLITFYHDWWPDLVYSKNPGTLAYLDRCYRKLADDSDLVLAVSRELVLELGVMENCMVLPPIPAQPVVNGRSLSGTPAEAATKQTLVYAGTLEGTYGAMVRDLGMALLDEPGQGWTLRAYGPASDWPSDVKDTLTEHGIYGGILSQGPQLQAALEAADALLVVMDFVIANRSRVRTSFPSKILDYLGMKKPIIAWGPADCFANRFVSEHGLGVSCEDPDAAVFLRMAELFWANEIDASTCNSTGALAGGEFSAGEIHKVLVSEISTTISKP